MENFLQYKDLGGSGVVKDVDTKNRIVTGYLSRFGNKDHDGDIILPGAFKRSIDQRREKLRFLNQHRWHEPHGGFAVLKEDNYGLYFESNPLIDTTYSENAIKLYQAGIIEEHSIGFIINKSSYDDAKEAHVISEVKLFEGSNVTLGANENTPFLGFKNVTPEYVDKHIKKIVKMIRNGDLTDDGFVMLEYALKTLERQAFELGKKALGEGGPPKQSAPGKTETDSLLKLINNAAR